MPSKNDTLISPQLLLCNRQDGERKAGCVSEDEVHTKRCCFVSHKYRALVRGRRLVIISELIAYI